MRGNSEQAAHLQVRFLVQRKHQFLILLKCKVSVPYHSHSLVTSHLLHLLPQVGLGRLCAGRWLQADWENLLILIMIISLQMEDQYSSQNWSHEQKHSLTDTL